MSDFYLKAADEKAMDAALIEAGLVVESFSLVAIGFKYDGAFYENYSDIPHTGTVDKHGDMDWEYPEGIETVREEQTVLVPAPGVSLDRIGPFSKVSGYDEKGEPILKHYPEYHCNVRAPGISDEAVKVLEPLAIVPPEQPYRVFA